MKLLNGVGRRDFRVLLIAVALASQSCGQSEESASSQSKVTAIRVEIPQDYESRSACSKQEFLWKEIEGSRYASLPAWEPFDAVGLLFGDMRVSLDRQSDFMPEGRKKHIHTLGSVAKIRFVGEGNTSFTGLYEGADCALIRLSLAANPAQAGFVPGMALKFFVDGKPSLNQIAMHSLDGQGNNYNYFANELSNQVASPENPVLKVLKLAFERATKHATKLGLERFAQVKQNGVAVTQSRAPARLYYLPDNAVQMPTAEHDFRTDLAKIASGTTLYRVYAAQEDGSSRVLLGRIETTSPFVASRFGDQHLFFKHERFRNE